MGRMIEFIFTRVYLAMLATGIFWALTFCGGILFGFGPASATIMSLYAEHGSDYKQYAWSEAWSLYKENFRRANQVFYTFFLIEAILIYGMYQIFILLVNLIFLLVAPLTFAVYLKLQVHFDLSYLNSLKLSFIGAFLDIRAVTKFLLGTFLLGVVTHFVPALFFFVLLGLWHFFVNDIFQPVYETIRSKVVS